ncbi:MAG: peptidoglycan-binding protein [Alphaproteobacteria bacterium]|nr:MAG: peptidoglycan-binding protein [Alphaproteobacteria bacterium]
MIKTPLSHAPTGWVLAALLALAGCDAGTGPDAPAADGGEEAVITDFALAPPGARPGACYGKDVTPAVIERVTERILVEPPKLGPDGTVIAPAKYEERTSQKVVKGREVIYFETPCPPRWTPEFIASVQRALAARGFYSGPASGRLDTATRAAIRRFQLSRGLNSGILSTENARALGLVEVDLTG